MLRVSGHGPHGFAFTLPPLLMLPDGSPPPPSQHIQVPKRIKGVIQMECKNFNNIKPNDSAWDQKKKKGAFFSEREGEGTRW